MTAKMILPILLLGAASAMAETHVSVGIHVGGVYGHYPPPPVYAYRPPCPGPGHVWISGYWYGHRPHYKWRRGYWAPPPHRGWRKGKRHHPPASYYRYDGRDRRHWRRR